MSRTRHVGAGVPPSRLPNFSERSTQQPDVVIHGWTVFAHPLFLYQYEKLLQQVAELRAKDPPGYEKKNAAKRLAAIVSLAFNVIPQDPARPEYRQCNTRGDEHKHWFWAKFFQQYRLFFRFHAPSKVIVLGWVNDADTERTYESDSDAYLVFKKMLANGHPPSDWEPLRGTMGRAPRCFFKHGRCFS
ncbi:type II toxin-antitoxin system YhaV family toxin [Hydrogenophaga sp. SL48]|uniref:type II toxin-antitoxin system YhaV family toxin n=1 Tax=Hydrogenophaga sp. SL48 TaxID=2806347 RepID=UPI001F40AA1F|nr:type II toxin-antitoxin system YhaV family toxin [Hydrogenophaga sp. SL48]UJW81149.1 type II toxin-antitoxin system YhaV family toxin [Hydrogenophaga sp. SL48]